jgi:hypothetical protein
VQEQRRSADELRRGRAGVPAERKREPHAEQAEERQASGDARGLGHACEETANSANAAVIAVGP